MRLCALWVVLLMGCCLSVPLWGKTETLDYLPRPIVGLSEPITWGPGLKVLIFGGPSHYHDHQILNRDIDGNTLHAIKASTIYTEKDDDLAAGLKDADVFLCAAPEGSKINEAGRQAIIDFLARGKGIIFSHDALWSDAWGNWPEKFQSLTGRTASNHVLQAMFPVTVVKPDHPVMRGVPATFQINDELYRCKPVANGAPTEILATAVDDKGETYPMVWTLQYNHSRIVCIPMGHNEDAHHNEAYRKILQNAVLWVSDKTDAQKN
jgi:type 1 glutamine amidotransferase